MHGPSGRFYSFCWKLSAFLSCVGQPIAHDALSALINLSDNLAVARHIVDKEFLVWLVSYTAVSRGS